METRRYWQSRATPTQELRQLRQFRNEMRKLKNGVAQGRVSALTSDPEETSSKRPVRLKSLLISAARIHAERVGGLPGIHPGHFELGGESYPDWREREAIQTALDEVANFEQIELARSSAELLETCADIAFEFAKSRAKGSSNRATRNKGDLARIEFESCLPRIFARYFRKNPTIPVDRESGKPVGPFLGFWNACLIAVGEQASETSIHKRSWRQRIVTIDPHAPVVIDDVLDLSL